MKRTILILMMMQAAWQLQAQLPNAGFENVAPGDTTLEAQNWYQGEVSNIAASGNYSLVVYNWYWYGKGYAFNGDVAFSMVPTIGTPFTYGGSPISFAPTALTGMVSYDTTLNSGAIDTGLIQITLSRFNAGTGQREVVGFSELPVLVSNGFVPFSLPVQYTSTEAPDTVVVTVLSSLDGFCAMNSNGRCLYLRVDDLALDGPNGRTPFTEIADPIQVSPNPVQDWLNFSREAAQVRIVNAMGAEVMQLSHANGADLSALSPGVYGVEFSTEEGIKTGFRKIVVE